MTLLIFQVVSCASPQVRQEALGMAAWLSVKM
jgi:hypothetical protein